MKAISPEGRQYWLAHSEGFRVLAPGGRIGTVEAVVERLAGEAHALVVRSGLLGRRLLVIGVNEVEEVAPRRQELRLRQSPEVGSADYLAELLRRLPPDGLGAPEPSGR